MEKFFFIIFLLQVCLAFLISVPLQVTAIYPRFSLNYLDYIFVAVCLIGLLTETVADWQLLRFKANPSNRGKICDYGLWAQCRHPNYFGDSVFWWGIYFLSIQDQWALLYIFSPMLMTYLLLKVSGVRLLEKI